MSSILEIYKKCWKHRKVRFFFVGCFNTLFDFVLLNIFFGLFGFPLLVANTLSAGIAITNSYFLNHFVVFRSSRKYSFGSYLRFLFVTGLSVLLVQNIVIYIVTSAVETDPRATIYIFNIAVTHQFIEINLAKATAVIAGMIWNYLSYKHIIFRQHETR